MYSTSVYSRTFPDAPSWEDGGLEVRSFDSKSQ